MASTLVPSSDTRLPSPQPASSVATPENGMRLLQLINLAIGFLGIQFAWAVQMGQMSPLLERLGSDPRLTAWISCAGPVTGILVQPIVGELSDRCASSLGRRRPFLILGAILTALCLVWMPNVPALWMAAVLLWILDASINVSQGPYRAMISDVVPRFQQSTAFALTSLTIGLGSVASFYIGSNTLPIESLFYLGASAMVIALTWTMLTTPEAPLTKAQEKGASGDILKAIGDFFVDTFKGIAAMPAEGLKLCFAHSLTWFGLMCLFVFFSLYVPHHIFGATDPNSPLYQEGVRYASLCYMVMNLVCFLASPMIGPLSRKFSKKAVHSVGLVCMAIALTMLYLLPTGEASALYAMAAMGLIGIGWATTLSLPYAMLSDHIPNGKEGILMGTFNIFIAAPGVLSNLLVGQLVAMSGNNVAVALLAGGIAMLASVISLQGVKEDS